MTHVNFSYLAFPVLQKLFALVRWYQLFKAQEDTLNAGGHAVKLSVVLFD